MSTTIEDRIRDLGLTVPDVVAPVASYAPTATTGNLVYTAGQLPMIDGALPERGVVSETPGDNHVSPERAKELAARAALNAVAAIKAELTDLDRVVRVVKVTGFVASAPDFYGQPGVVDGASTLLGEIFGEAGKHARSAVGVSVLPLNSPVEVELIVEFR